VRAIGRMISVRFDANVDAGMGWAFAPEQTTISLPIGQRRLAFFTAENRTGHTITGAASYNIAPEEAARYFTKVQCFCFTRQVLKPGEKVRMPVVFYVNPAILDDADVRDIQQLTLSYTFHPAAGAQTP
ncbi:MAG TPA: cytochrome c oxidase assembly protein, partial [Novosphingobium sp.]|nr:cytochrome c oxidase assembly protein [Novosphingobium sp.]